MRIAVNNARLASEVGMGEERHNENYTNQIEENLL
jgi:hypothetical protein